MSGPLKSFQVPMNVKIEMAVSAYRESGSMMAVKIFMRLAPSIMAACRYPAEFRS